MRREGRVRNGAAKKIERLLERAIVRFVRRQVLAALRLEMATERGLAQIARRASVDDCCPK